jgi:hypothetical protein
MGTTPNYAIPYPEPTDFVADGATQMENLAERTDLALFALGMGRNRLINGDFRVAQRGTNITSTSSIVNNDVAYTLDRWILLSDGNDIVDVTRANVAPNAGQFSIGLDVETANKKFGILQIIENRNIVGMFNQPVTLSFSARTSGSSIGNLKAVILSWNDFADGVIRDVVSSWNADGVTPTFAANWTAENTPQNLSPSNTWTRYSITATLDTANTNNVAVFIWCDDMTTTLGDFLYINDVQLEVGSLATPFERKTTSTVIQECQRYFEKSYDIDTAPATVVDNGTHWGDFTSHADATSISPISFKVTKRIASYTTKYWQQDGLANNWQIVRSGIGITSTIPVAFSRGQSAAHIYVQTGAAWVAVLRYGHWTVDCEM